ncbi:MAG: glycosyltransferase, partial [Proteobacteria bacterium]|nr:glycosyltransferase [Pseudomonadota bacterium]
CLSQTFSEIEVILIDDGSNDETFGICSQYAQKNSCINFVSQKHEGASKARNEGAKIAQGDYLIFVDADDFLAPDMLQIHR